MFYFSNIRGRALSFYGDDLKIWRRGIWWVEIWSLFDWFGELHPNSPIMENSVAPKCSKPIRMLEFFRQNFFWKGLSFEFIFCLPVQHYDWNLQNKFWLLMALGVLCRCVSVKVKLVFFWNSEKSSCINMQA